MTSERIEAALRGEVPADEATFRPRPLPATVAQARVDVEVRDRRPFLAMAVAATAAVVLASAVGVAAWTMLNQDDGHGAGSEPSPSASAGQPAIAPPCGAGDFQIVSDPWDSGAGSRGTTIVLRVLDSTAACVHPQVVGAVIRDVHGAVLVMSRNGTVGGRPAPTARYTAGTQLELGVAWSNWCGAPPDGPRLSLMLGTDEVPVDPTDGSDILVPPCMGVGQPTALSVTDLQPSERPPIGD